jgi:hypothetical protein
MNHFAIVLFKNLFRTEVMEFPICVYKKVHNELGKVFETMTQSNQV